MYNSFVAGYMQSVIGYSQDLQLYLEVAGDQRLDLERILSFS